MPTQAQAQNHKYSVLNTAMFDHTKEPMFFGNGVGIARFDSCKHRQIADLTDKTLSFFWHPDEINVTKDAQDFNQLTENERWIFLANLKYQTLLDSIAGRSPNLCFLPNVSLPEVETWIETWSFSETIHSRSYTHILRGILPRPDLVLDSILLDEEILKRAAQVSHYYDELHEWNCRAQLREVRGVNYSTREHMKAHYLCMVSVCALEAVRFYVSFACSFSFAERELMNGNAEIIKLICRDEALHYKGTQFMIRQMQNGGEGEMMKNIAIECQEEATKIWIDAADQEKEWSDYLFKDGSMQGMNAKILYSYIEYLTDQRMRSCGFDSPYDTIKNPLPWMRKWTNSSNVQTTPQAKPESSYLTASVAGDIATADFTDDEL